MHTIPINVWEEQYSVDQNDANYSEINESTHDTAEEKGDAGDNDLPEDSE